MLCAAATVAAEKMIVRRGDAGPARDWLRRVKKIRRQGRQDASGGSDRTRADPGRLRCGIRAGADPRRALAEAHNEGRLEDHLTLANPSC